MAKTPRASEGRVGAAKVARAGALKLVPASGTVDSDRGRRMIKLMNALHHRPDIQAEDMTYILNALIGRPHPLHGTARLATGDGRGASRDLALLRRAGAADGIVDRPTSYEHAVEQLDRMRPSTSRPAPRAPTSPPRSSRPSATACPDSRAR